MDNLYVGDEARAKLIAGVDKVANAVKGTLGAAGYNGLLEDFEYPFSITTNDGILIARQIKLEDPVENIGANLVKEIASRSDKQGGDGTTTAVTLAQAILHEGIKIDAAPMALKKSLEECLPIIEASIKDQTKQLVAENGTFDETMLERVASISAEDEKIGKTIADIYLKIGKDGILYPDVAKTMEDSVAYSSGVKVEDAGLASPYMADVDEKTMQPMNAANMTDVRVLITKQKITQARRDLENTIGKLMSNGVKELVIFCDEWEPTVIPDLVTTRFQKGFRVALIKLSVIWKDQWFEDLALLTGATIIDGIGLTLQRTKLEHLGEVGKFLSDKNNTFLEGTRDVEYYIKQLNEDGTDESKIRAARLNTKTARLFVGAPTDAALSYRRLKVEDARNAAYQALHGGVVAGGGVALMTASEFMPDTIGGNILKIALTAPFRQIVENAGMKASELGGIPQQHGFNAKTGKVVDMWEAGIMDPATVVMSSVRNAISVAATVLTARVVTTLNRDPATAAQTMNV